MENNKSSGKVIVKGAMILSASVLLTKIISILYRVPVTNALGDIGNGIYSVAYQVYVLLITLTSIGLPSAISKLVSERVAVGDHREAHRVYKVAMIYSVLLACVLSVVLWFGAEQAATFFGMKEAMWPIRTLVPAVVIVTIMAVMKGYFQGMQSMMPTAVAQVVEQIVHAIVSIVLAYGFLKFGLEAAVVGSMIGVVVGVIVGLVVLLAVYYMVRPRIKKRIAKSKSMYEESNVDILKKILYTSIPIMLSASVFSIMTTIDYRMMADILPSTIEKMCELGTIYQLPVDTSLLSGSDAIVGSLIGFLLLPNTDAVVGSLVGIFSFKYMTILNLPVNLILTLGMAATPAVAASMAQNDLKDVRKKIRMVIKIGMIFAAPAAVGLMVFGKEVVAFLLPQEPYGGELLAAGAVAIIFITIAQLTAGILQGLGKQHVPTINAVIACVIKVVLNVILLSMPQFNVYAVIHTTTICYIIYAFLNAAYMLRIVKMKLNATHVIIKPIIVAVAMGIGAKGIYELLMRLAPYSSIWLIVAILLAVVIYGIFGVMMGMIGPKDLEMIPGGNKLAPYLNRLTK